MSLVTRCTTCGTVFRVVQDQLKVSAGWVRCGRCGEVFNALQTLFDLERDGPVPAATPPVGGAPAGPPAGFRPSAFAGLTDEPPASALESADRRVLRGALTPTARSAQAGPAIPGTAYGLAPPERPAPPPPEPSDPFERPPPRSGFRDDDPDDSVPADDPSAASSPWPDAPDPADDWSGGPGRPVARAGHDDDPSGDPDRTAADPHGSGDWDGPPAAPGPLRSRGEGLDEPPDDADSSRPAGADGGSIWPTDSRPARWIEPALDGATGGGTVSDSRQMVVLDATGSAEAPAFLREDARRQRAASPVVRGLLGFAVLVLAALLMGQWALHERDRVADLWPWSRPMLAQACRVSGCELLEAPRRLDAFTVESTTLTRAAAGQSAYRLSITLRNRSPRAATLPSVELALTDTDGQLVARRALHPSDFRIQRAVVPGGADTTLQLLMSAPRDRINGYTIEIFYP